LSPQSLSHSRSCHDAKITASTLVGSSCGLDVMNSSASSSIEAAKTMSPLVGPSSDVDIPDRSWPTIPTESLCSLIQELLRKERRRKSGQSQIHKNTQDKTQIVAEHTERLKKMMR